MLGRTNKEHRANKHHASGIILTLLCVLIMMSGACGLLSGGQQAASLTEAPPELETSSELDDAPELEGTPDTPAIEYQVGQDLSISSANAILLRLEDGSVLFEKNGGEKMYPASMTKIMTAVVALENLSDLSEIIALNEEMYAALEEADASVAGFEAGEEARVIDLLYGLMLPSGAECAVGLAEYVSGTESEFVSLMNEKARRLNMNGTRFTNATGLHDSGHYSTAKDISALLEYSVKNDAFYKIFTSKEYNASPTNLRENGAVFYSSLFSRLESEKLKGAAILGGKTGYTDEAGQCLASLAEKDGARFILVSCGASGNNKTQFSHIEDAVKIYNAIPKTGEVAESAKKFY
jgi:D-alanyl-D-alanine carboxypeptidase (penicillin-binding protein 5/6)